MELIVISDLHLSAGYEEKTGKYSRNEDFFFDEEFKRFLEYLQQLKPLKKHLIIAGDMFDFLQVDGHKATELYKKGGAPFKITKKERKYGLGTEADKTEWKLKVIANGHPAFFEALANFLSEGHRLSIITGNHDIELYWDNVQNALKREILKYTSGSKANKEQIEKRINFYPWFYYDEKYKTYIEHGNQYDKFNSFQYFLYPVFGADSKRLWLPFGSFFVRYFFNKLEVSNPFADNIKPITKYVEWAWCEHKLELLKIIWHHLPMMLGALRKRGKFSKTDRIKLNKTNEGELVKLSQTFNLPLGTVKEINRLMAMPFTRSRLSILVFFAGTIFFIITLIALIALLVLRIFYKFSPWTLLSPLGLLIVPIAKWVYYKFFQKSFFEKNMPKIKKIKENLEDVQTIIFGHSHDPELRKLNEECWYVNTGTWTTVFSEEERIIREAKQFAFVWINEAGKKPELLRWNQNLNQHERLILFEPKPITSIFRRSTQCEYSGTVDVARD